VEAIAKLIAQKIGITTNYQALYQLAKEQLEATYGYDDSDEEDEETTGWGVENTVLTIIKNDVLDEAVDTKAVLSNEELNYLQKRVHNLDIHIEKQGNSTEQDWELWFNVDLSEDEANFIVHCCLRFTVNSYYIRTNTCAIVSDELSEDNLANKLEKMYVYELLKDKSI